MLDYDLSVYLWMAFVFLAVACLGFIAGVQGGERFQRHFVSQLAAKFNAALIELHATLERVKEYERQHERPGNGSGSGGFAFGTTGAPAQRAHERSIRTATHDDEPKPSGSGAGDPAPGVPSTNA